MKVDIVTLFPRYFESVFQESILQRAISAGLLEIETHDLRQYSVGKHKQADDYRFGGGAGMLMMPEPFFQVMNRITADAPQRPLVIFPSPLGKVFDQSDAIELAKERRLVFICGHYKGVDERVIERWVDRQYSIGDYVLTGGEPATAVMIDATARMISGTLGDFDSARGDSFYEDRLDSLHYTRPEVIEGMTVPGVLMNGHHKNINRWRGALSHFITKRRRPDLIKK